MKSRSSAAATPSPKTPVDVLGIREPPVRKEGAGFLIRDVMDGLPYLKGTDPFLLMHELPRHNYKRGEMPGAPLHPHRGFNEVPYCKEMSGEFGYMLGRTHTGKKGLMRPGSLEWGRCGNGIQHEALVDPRFEGWMHFFQLWVNLPEANKFDNPCFQNAESGALPVVELEGGTKVKVLVGQIAGATSPVDYGPVPIQYADFMVPASSSVRHTVPAEDGLTTKMAYVYAGGGTAGRNERVVAAGQLLVLGEGDTFQATAGAAGLHFMFMAGRPIGERPYQMGPFVMSSRAQLEEAFMDMQLGRLTSKPTSYIQYPGADGGTKDGVEGGTEAKQAAV